MSFSWIDDNLDVQNEDQMITINGLLTGEILFVDVLSYSGNLADWFLHDGNGNTWHLDGVPMEIDLTQNYLYLQTEGGPITAVLSLMYGGNETLDIYEYPAMVPAAISSELDDGGEERIHIAAKQSDVYITPTPPANCLEAQTYEQWGGGGTSSLFYAYYDTETGGPTGMQDAPQWLIDSAFDGGQIYIDFFNNGTFILYNHYNGNAFQINNFGDVIEADTERPVTRGTIYSSDMSQSVCFDWYIPAGV